MQNEQALHLGFWTVTRSQEMISVISDLPEANPNWRYTDEAGHEHRWTGDGYPTLRWVTDFTYWCQDCRDDHEDGHRECLICGEHIVPGTRLHRYPRYIAGPWRVDLAYDDGRSRRQYGIVNPDDAEALAVATDAETVAAIAERCVVTSWSEQSVGF
jgi:hypothetical protein